MSAISRALAKASPLKPEIRLAQAVSEFEADLSTEQKSTFRNLKTRSLSTPPNSEDVMRFTAEVDRSRSRYAAGKCFGPRFTNFLQGVQQFAALGDIVVGGSQNLVACGVWSLVRMSLLSVVNLSNYIDQLSTLFMDIGRSSPCHQALALLYPRSTNLQSYLTEYFIVVVKLCHHIFNYGQKSVVQKFASGLRDSDLHTFRATLDMWAKSIKEEFSMTEAQESSGFRALSKKVFRSTTYQQKIASRLRVLDFCSTYDHQTTWKQIRKAGNTLSFVNPREYELWRSFKSYTLVYTGKLGSGKSVLLANMVDDINLARKDRSYAMAYFFCRHDIPDSLKARTALGSLARQLLSTLTDLAGLEDACVNTPGNGTIEDVLKILVRGFPAGSETGMTQKYVIVDGLDECSDEERKVLMHALRTMQKSLEIRICLSLRTGPDTDLPSITKQFPGCSLVSMPHNNPDIEAFIHSDLERCLNLKKLVISEPTLILEIQDALVRGSHGMFLWAALQIETLCTMKTDSAIRAALEDLPQTLGETFARILRKSGSSDQALQTKTLQLVLAAYKPLTTYELREALSVVPGDATWDPGRLLNDVQSALACCGCLLVIDEEELTVRVIHHSVKQHLYRGRSSKSDVTFSAVDAQRMMADTIVTYLGYGVFGTELTKGRVKPFMAQAAPSQIMQATVGSSSATLKIAMRLLKSSKQPEFDISKTIAEARGLRELNPAHKFSFYPYAASHWWKHILYVSNEDAALLALSKKLIDSPLEVNNMMRDDVYFHPECTRSSAGETFNEVLLKWMLETENINPNMQLADGIPRVLWAAERGYKDTVEHYLFSHRIDVNASNNDGWTLSIWAAEHGYTDILESLLKYRELGYNAKDVNGSNALSFAASAGHKDIVKLLLDQDDIQVDQKNNDGWTPLISAACNGHRDIVELLLRTGKVDINTKIKRGQTALALAEEKGHTEIAELLKFYGAVHPQSASSMSQSIQTSHMGGWSSPGPIRKTIVS